MGVGLGGSFYWQPGGSSDMGGSPWGQSMLEQNTPTAFYRYGVQNGIPDDNSSFSRWFKQQFPSVQTGYNAYTISNPLSANITDYLNSLGGFDEWYRRYMKEAPQVRGLDPSSRGGGPVRWVGR